MSQKHLWYSYDFANSFMGIVIIFYFPLILIDRGGQELWIGVTSSIATACMLLMLPRIGHYVDTTGRARFVLLASTLCSALTLIALAIFFSVVTTFSENHAYLALFLFGLFYLFYESALTVYSGLMRSTGVASELPRTSGFGYAFGQVGNVVCLLLTKFLLGASFAIYVIADKPLALLLGGVVGFLLTLPYILTIAPRTHTQEMVIAFSYRRMIAIIQNDKRLLVFLIAMLLLYDTILTLQLYITSYLKTVFGFSESLVLYAGVTGLFFGIIGAALGGFIATKFLLPTKILTISAVLYAFCALLFAFSSNSVTFVISLLALCGISYGMVFSLGRTVYALIIPEKSQHEYFGIFTVFERMAAVVGPLLWTVTFLLMSEFGKIVQYRASVFGLAVIAVLAFVILLHFHKKHGATIALSVTK